MNFEEFNEELVQQLKKIGEEIEEQKAIKLYRFMLVLLQENKKINLTSIVEPKEVILKHFVDSLTVNRYIKNFDRIIDVGTGAGFPGIPLAIFREDIQVHLLDSLNKRVEFLKRVKDEEKIDNTEIIWGRAEEIARKEEYRETFDVAVSRAVAPLNILAEYLLPYLKVGGTCICMKGPNYREETKNLDSILKKLGGKFESVEEVILGEMKREIVLIRKVEKTNEKYPRKAGMPSKNPLC